MVLAALVVVIGAIELGNEAKETVVAEMVVLAEVVAIGQCREWWWK